MKTAEVTEFNGINTNCDFQLPVLYFSCRGSHSKYRTARGSHKQEYENHLFEKKNVTFFFLKLYSYGPKLGVKTYGPKLRGQKLGAYHSVEYYYL